MSNNMDLKKVNQTNVYKYIYASDEVVSKYELVDNLKLSLPTVNLIIKRLLENEYIYASGTFESGGGRPPKAYTYNPSLYYAIGLDITRNHVHAVLIDLSGAIIEKTKGKLKFINSKAYFNFLIASIDELLKKSGIKKEKILGVGIALPLMINFEEQKLLHDDLTEFSGLTGKIFEEHLGIPCIMCNDANAGGLAENWNIRDLNNSFYLSLNNTVGGAILRNNGIYMGETFESGEIGHVTLVPNGRVCYCGKHGCTDPYISALLLSNSADESLDKFFEYVKEGNSYHVNIWNEYLEYLTVTINNLKMIFDCPIIAGGYVGPYLEKYEGHIKSMLIERNTYSEEADYFRVCKYKRFSTAVGAALLNIEKFLNELE
ncbi:ROK family protein [Lachnospiraceae bacterium ZAX-1]